MHLPMLNYRRGGGAGVGVCVDHVIYLTHPASKYMINTLFSVV